MKWIRILASAVAMTTFAGITEAAISDCPAPHGVVEVVLPSGLPGILRDRIGDVALPGEPFDSTDVYAKGHKHRRYIFVWNIGSRWIVAMEQGGITLRAAIFAYDLGKDGKGAVLIEESIAFPESACASATKLVEKRNQIGHGK